MTPSDTTPQGAEPREDGRVYVEVSGLTEPGKSAVLGEIEIALKALGLSVETDAAHQAEKNGTHADWQSALDLYQPTVVLTERNVSRSPAPAAPTNGGGVATKAVRLALEDANALERCAEDADDNQWQDWGATMRQAAQRIRRLAALNTSEAR